MGAMHEPKFIGCSAFKPITTIDVTRDTLEQLKESKRNLGRLVTLSKEFRDEPRSYKEMVLNHLDAIDAEIKKRGTE
jgi:hypothetical protein